MDREKIYEYLCMKFPREKYLDIHLRHNTPPGTAEDFFTLLTKLSPDYDSHNIPLLTWNHALSVMQDAYRAAPDADCNVVLVRQPRLEIPEHTHTFFEIFYILTGTSAQSVNGNPETFREGDFCILPPSARHQQTSFPEGVAIKIMIRPSAFTDICTGLLKGQDMLSHFLLDSIYNENSEQYLVFRTGQDEGIRGQVLDMFQEMFSTDSYTDRIVAGMLMTLLTKLSRNWPAAVESAPVRNVDHEILTYLQENYSTITLEELARHLHYTVPYCSRYVKKLFGCTFSQLLNQIRFQKAHLFLKNSSLTVNQISKMLGYENPENFMRAFKKIHKMTPSQYRELYHRKTGEERPS